MVQILNDLTHCTACTACTSACPVQAITLQPNAQGFLYPQIDTSLCINCKKCVKVCPINNPPTVSTTSQYYAAYNKDNHQRLSSTSGGIFSLFAEEVIQLGGVVYGAAYGENHKVHHIQVDTIEDIPKLQGAKYTQSELGDTFRNIRNFLTAGKFVLFSGTPCQVAGLKSYLGKDYDNLFTVDLVCHGVPSPKAWDSYIQYRQQQDSQQQKAQTINLRSKQTGWSHYQYSVQFQYEDGFQYAKKSGEDIYMKSFVQNLTIRPSCNDCHFKGVHRCSDFTLGDFWGIWNIKPHMDDNKGTSLVLVHTEKGKKLWETIATKYVAEEVAECDTYKENPSLIKPSATSPYRDELLNQLDTQSFAVIEEKLKELQPKEKRPSLLYRILRKIKRTITKVFQK